MKHLQYAAAFSFIFKDRNWAGKLALASLLTCTLVGAAPVIGWTVNIAQRVACGTEPIVPEFKNWRNFWKLGGQFALINAIWLLPLLLAVIIIYLPLLLINTLPDEAILAVFAFTLIFVFIFLLIYSTIYIFVIPAMIVLLVKTGSPRQAMNPRRLLQVIRPRFMDYLIIFLVVGMALFNITLIVSFLSLFILLAPMLVYAGLVTAHFAGQLALGEQ